MSNARGHIAAIASWRGSEAARAEAGRVDSLLFSPEPRGKNRSSSVVNSKFSMHFNGNWLKELICVLSSTVHDN